MVRTISGKSIAVPCEASYETPILLRSLEGVPVFIPKAVRSPKKETAQFLDGYGSPVYVPKALLTGKFLFFGVKKISNFS
jgi:hypothetical protein